MLDFQGKKVLVIGIARSGQAALRFLTSSGAQVTATDLKQEEDLGKEFQELKELPATFVTGRYPRVKRGEYDLIIISPGVPPTIFPVQKARKLGIPVWSELELAARLIKQPIIAVTGTNGKTTTTSLLGFIFQKAGIDCIVAGNIGIPLIQEVERTRRARDHVAYWVVEVSSFQLELIETFRPRIAVFLNLTPDHLDRHGTLENYGRTKARIFENQSPGDFAVLNYDDPWLLKLAPDLKSQIYWFSRQGLPGAGIGREGDWIKFTNNRAKDVLCAVHDIKLPGPHNLENALAAAAAALLAGIKQEVIVQALATFPGVPHRMELVRVINGVKYVNDSKGTNPESVLKALDAYQEPVILIAGGKNKGSDFCSLAKKINQKVKALILLGEAAPLIGKAVRAAGFYQIWEVASLTDAVQTAYFLAQPGDVVLLSPACASWDMFRDFEERGNLFRQLVNQL
ncbi:MAG: UDP-N-acetylmuramoyl-L-alanine--D-glutamate ligase [Bacillota bacterium]|nr:UDP-N-acetylmuramoyl-L-alanine--D-glutamate ligase [Bacillota bacterium]